MSLSDEALRRLLNECNTKLNAHRREQQTIQAMSASKERERRLNDFTVAQLQALEDETATFRAVGKMFLAATPTEIIEDLEKQNKDVAKDLEALGKKRDWIERQISDLNNTLRDVMRTSGRA
ncbi:Prefoldin [Hyaloraphidium curvatum]|nr:Prefoldin [Hyaloraphidium curvatum]